MSLSGFFNPDDGLTVFAVIVGENVTLTGYFDILDEAYFLDDSEGETRAEFVCETEFAPKTVVGKTLLVEGDEYRINARKADATGVSTLSLIA